MTCQVVDRFFIPLSSLPNSPFDFMCSQLELPNLLSSPFSSFPWACHSISQLG